MSTGTRFPLSQRLVRGLFAVLALLAVSVAVASPVCDSFHASADAPQPDTCCASLEDGALALPPTAAPSAQPPAFVAVSAGSSVQWRALSWPDAAVPPDRPPLTRPYHARSARILI